MKKKSIAQIVTIATICFILITSIIFYILKTISYNYSFEHLQDSLISAKALRKYVSSQQKEEVYKLQKENNLSKEYFQPQLLSSTFSTKSVNNLYNQIRKEQGLEPIVLRFASNNPRNPQNKASKFEQELLEKFNNKTINSYKEIRYNEEGKKVMYYAIPSRALEAKCMKCHSTPNKAPKELIETYGSINGFHEKIGDIRALISTQYPLTKTDDFIFKANIYLAILTFIILSLFVYLYIRFSNKLIKKNTQLEELNNTLEQKVAKETHSLQINNKKLQSIIRGSKLGYWQLDIKTGELEVNQRWLNMLGINKSQFSNHISQWEDIILDEDKKKTKESIQNAIKEDSLYTIELKVKHHDGYYVWIEQSGSVIERDSNGEAKILSGYIKDISVRKKFELQILQKNDELKIFKQIIDNVNTGATITKFDEESKEHLVVYANDTFEKITAYKKEEVLGKNLRLLQGEDREQEAIAIMKEAIQNEKSCEVEIRNYKKDGTLFHNLVTLSPIFNEDGKLMSFIGLQHDITDIKNNELKLQQQAKLASLGEMIANIAHQWRQPLSVISTVATGLQFKKEMDILEDAELLEGFDNINDNAQYLSQTIDDFKNYIKGDSRLTVFDLESDTKSFLKLINSTINKYNINVILNLEEHIEVQGYPNELNQCFINIFNNAKDALVEHNTEDQRYIFISQYTKDNDVVIEFKDNAGGISETIKDKIFDPYFTTKHQSQGTGLGLSMSYNLITSGMNGTLECYNKEYEFNNKKYKGAVFKITLPINKVN